MQKLHNKKRKHIFFLLLLFFTILLLPKEVNLIQIYYIKQKKDYYNNTKIDYWLEYKSKMYIKEISTTITILMYSADLFAKSSNAQKLAMVESKVNNSGDLIVKILQLFIYWLTLFFGLLEIIKTIKKQNLSGVVSLVLKYGSIMLASYSMPALWDFIKELFIEE